MIRSMGLGFWSGAMDHLVERWTSNKSLLGGTCENAEVSQEQGVVGIWHSCIYNLICNTSLQEYTSVCYLISNIGVHTVIHSRLYLLDTGLLVACLIPQDKLHGCARTQRKKSLQLSGIVELGRFLIWTPSPTTLIWPPFQLFVSPSFLFLVFPSLLSFLWFPS